MLYSLVTCSVDVNLPPVLLTLVSVHGSRLPLLSDCPCYRWTGGLAAAAAYITVVELEMDTYPLKHLLHFIGTLL